MIFCVIHAGGSISSTVLMCSMVFWSSWRALAALRAGLEMRFDLRPFFARDRTVDIFGKLMPDVVVFH